MKNANALRILLVCTVAFTSLAFRADTLILSRGTSIFVELLNEENAELLEVGNLIEFRVRDEVYVNGYAVVVTNSPANGEVIRVSYDEIQIEVRSIKAVDGKWINVRGRFSAKRPCRKCCFTLKKATGIFVTVLDDVKIRY